MSKHNQDECPLCQGSGEVDITPIGEPDSERSSYGCPMCIAADRDEAEQQRDIAWQELRQIRGAIKANPEEATADEVERVVAQRDNLLAALEEAEKHMVEDWHLIDSDRGPLSTTVDEEPVIAMVRAVITEAKGESK